MTLSKEKIIVVEDNAFMRQLLVDTLELSGASPENVRSFANGAAALAYLLEGACTDAIVICDIALPLISGLELYARTRVQLPGLRFLFITALELSNSELLLIKGAGLTVLKKPFDSADLIAAVQEIADMRSAAGAP